MEALKSVEQAHFKSAVAQVQSGDTVRVHQKIREGNKQRIQVFEGVVIRTHRMNEVTAVITVRRIASNVGVEKTFLIHSPNVEKIEVVRRAKVRRNFLSYLRGRRGKSARLQELAFDKAAANVSDKPVEAPVAEEAPVDENIDAEITEVVDEDVKEDVSTEELAKEENKAAAADDASVSDDPGEEGDEAQMPAEEVEIGLDKASSESDE
jgi:large subunit ribosomal protein L19